MLSPIPRALQGWRVMVVDDEPDSLEIASRLLRMAGAEVITANGGQEALQKVRSARPQLIIYDHNAPTL